MITVSIILLNYNGKKFNKDCIDSILTQNYQNFEIIFVDQCSTDGSLEEVENIYQKEIKSGKIKVVKNTENNGFTGGNNLGVKHADRNSKYICLLNNDTVVQKDWLKELIKGIESDDELGGVSCLILNKGYETKEKKIYLSDYKKPSSSLFGETIYVKASKYDISKNVYYTTHLSGCCFLFKKNIINTPFEDYYFAYAEDVYLSRLLSIKGFKLGICINSVINHYGSGSFGTKPSQTKLFHGNKNQIINFLVFYPLFYRILLFPLFIIKELAHLFIGVPFLRLKFKLKGWVRILKNYNTIKNTRKLVYANNNIGYYQFLKDKTFGLSDSFFVEGIISKILISFGNFFFRVYGQFVLILGGLVNLLTKNR